VGIVLALFGESGFAANPVKKVRPGDFLAGRTADPD
jgi:hypothetical protein